MLSLQADEQIDRISARLADSGALAILLIEVEPLARIERRYGADAYQRSLEGLMGVVREVAHEEVPAQDVLVTEDRSRDAILAFFFRPRSDQSFYRSKLRKLASRTADELTRQGRRAVYPYHRDPLDVGVGISVVLDNPTVKRARQLSQAVEEARHDAQLAARLRTRETGWRLLEVILAGELNVRFEPIVELRSGRVMGYEALTRGPEGTHLETPQMLFGKAEQAGLLFELDCLCRRVALEQARILPRESKLFLNCLPTAIGDPNLRDEGLRKSLEGAALRPTDLVLEISESESIENFGVFREVRDSCRELGIGIAIDDAGSGYASLEAIMEIAPDFVKTDLGLVRGIDTDPPRQQVVSALHRVARGIGAVVIAEGIETEAELQVLRDLGIAYGQGYHFGGALSSRSESETES